MVSARKITTCHLNCSLVYGWVMWKICVLQIFIIKSGEWLRFNYNASAAVDGLLNIIMDSAKRLSRLLWSRTTHKRVLGNK